MECNKDEATRAKEIAERKFNAKDIAGAKKFAIKAERLYPDLEGIAQMLATLDVYISAENNVVGEADWYGILGVDPQADEETVRKQYRKLALMLHPDKNKSVGAEGAFKYISEAWSLLSNKSRRAAYDLKRNPRVFQQTATAKRAGTFAPSPGVNGFHNFAKSTASATATSNAKANKSSFHGNVSSASGAGHMAKTNTFWTVCHKCKMQYEYLRVYLNHKLLCPNCREAFFAIETPPPFGNGSQNNASQHQQNPTHQPANRKAASSDTRSGGFVNHGSGIQWTPFSRAGGASTVAQAASVVQQTYEKVKREREEAQAAKKRERASKKRRGMSDVGAINMNQMCAGNRGTGGVSSASSRPVTVEISQISGVNKPDSPRELPQMELRDMLIHKARKVIGMKMKEWRSASVSNGAARKERPSRQAEITDMGHQEKESREEADSKNRLSGDHYASASTSNLDTPSLMPMSISVPDPDFSDFDKDRTERCFEENQVWAAYDDDDGMPRYYAMIQCVISRSPFKAKISWLNSRTNSELGPLNWVGSGFAKTCGDFKLGKHEKNDSLNLFSHKVNWTKGTRGAIRVFPRKGDVWALYRNWSPKWNELTPDDVIHKYDMVEVLEDDEELGVVIIPLVKVAGFKTVFHRHLDPEQVKRIPREEIFRFSHQVPSYLLTGQEAPNAPKGCRELDPAATPFDLLEVIADGNEDHKDIKAINQNGVASDNIGKKTDDDDSVEILEEIIKAATGCPKKSEQEISVANDQDVLQCVTTSHQRGMLYSP